MLTQTLRFASLTSLTLLSAATVQAGQPHARLLPHPPHPAPGCHLQLPVFGMHSYNTGYGERVVRVRHGGIADYLGIEPGDTIVRLNHAPLNYRGAWRIALRNAMEAGGHVDLLVRDVRSGRLVLRHVDIDWRGNIIHGPVGPITPKTAPVVEHFNHGAHHTAARPVIEERHEPAPITFKSMMRSYFNRYAFD